MSNSLRHSRRPPRPRQLTALVDRWVASLDRSANDDGDRGTEEDSEVASSSTALQFGWNGVRLSHAGWLSPGTVRSVTLDDCVALAGHARSGAALWQALQHFGAPFDDVNTHRWHRGSFSWGVWGFDAATTADIINHAGRALGADAPSDDTGALPPELAPLRGQDETAIAGLGLQPIALARLVEAAQLAAVQRQQVAAIVQRSLRPLASDRFSDAELVALLVLDQRIGLGTARELVAQRVATVNPDSAPHRSWVAVATRQLTDAGQSLTHAEWQRLSTLNRARA